MSAKGAPKLAVEKGIPCDGGYTTGKKSERGWGLKATAKKAYGVYKNRNSSNRQHRAWGVRRATL